MLTLDAFLEGNNSNRKIYTGLHPLPQYNHSLLDIKSQSIVDRVYALDFEICEFTK